MQDFKYFSYGYSSDLRNSLYGLYQPVLNCFLIVFPDYASVGPQLAAVLSSRYVLQPLQINTASNYTHNIIDNEICERWTISNLDRILPTEIMTKVNVMFADQLIPVETSTQLIQIEKEKQWAQFCLFWLRFIRSECQVGATGLWIDNQIGNLDMFDVFEPVLFPNYREFVTKTMSLLYLGLDLEKTEQDILDLLNNTDDSLVYRFNKFLKEYF
jgi:hypothetical protein